MAKTVRVMDDDYEAIQQYATAHGLTFGEAIHRMKDAGLTGGAAPASSPAGAPDPADPPKPAPAPAKVQLPAFDMDPEEPEDDYDPKPNDQDVDPRGYQMGGVHLHLSGDALDRALAVIGGKLDQIDGNTEAIREVAVAVQGHTHDQDGELDEPTHDHLADVLANLPNGKALLKVHRDALPAGEAGA